ncbi:hypothetical protein HMPREF9538_03027, partial [Klebsiella sp. MS 92-3]
VNARIASGKKPPAAGGGGFFFFYPLAGYNIRSGTTTETAHVTG